MRGAFSSDLNPVACLILKVMLEDIPRHGPGLAEELRKVGGEIKRQAERELADLYPTDPDGATPIAYLWARTVRCEAPNCGAEIPLMRSFWLCKKPKRKRALRHRVVRPGSGAPRIEFEVFEPKAEKEVQAGTVTRAKATCVCCGAVLQPERVRAQLAAQKGGADVVFDDEGHRTGGSRMTAVVTLRPGQVGRHYRLPTDEDYAAVRKAQERVVNILDEWEREGKQGLCPVSDEPLPPIGTLGFRVQRYGMLQWGDLFTARQKVALVGLGSAIFSKWCSGNRQLVDLCEVLSCAISKRADYGSSGTKWHLTFEKTTCTFGRQAIPMTWDFIEPIPIGDTSGAFGAGLASVYSAIASISAAFQADGQIQQADATDCPLPDQTAGVWFTDPPYYDAVPYADLSDFFLVWLKRALPNHPLLRDPFDPENPLSPKTAEVVQDETKHDGGRPKNREWFEGTMAKAFAEGRRVLQEDGIGSVVFAHKTTEGWEALLSGMILGGWTITASWPIATERPGRLRAQDSAALATSVHLVCRPRSENAPVGDWAEVLRELPERVSGWMERLQGEGIRGADLVFACIGPALEIFSRYRAVETAEGHEVGLPEYLEKVWEVVGRAALQQVLGTEEGQARNGLAGALEEDARLTALFLWTLQSTEISEENDKKGEDDEEAVATVAAKGFSLPFDVVRCFAQPMGIDLDVWTDRIIGQGKGVVRLLPVAERAKGLFGEDGARAAADWIESDPGASVQATLFPEFEPAPRPRNRRPGKFGSEQVEEGLRYGVVPAVALAAHALDEAPLPDPSGEVAAGVLDTTVGVDDQPSRRVSACDGSLQCLQRDGVIERTTQGPADDAPRKQVDENHQIQPSTTDAQVGQITDPHLVRPLGGEIALQPIRRHRKPMLRVCRDLETAPHDRAQTEMAHASCHPILAHAPPPLLERLGDLRTARAALARFEEFRDLGIQPLRFLSMSAGWTTLPGVETTPRHLQDSAHLLNTPTRAVLGNEAVACHYRPSEKMATAFLKISRSRRTRSNSRWRRRTSSSRALKWPVPGKASSPLSFSCFFHRLMIPTLSPRRCSTSLAVIPCSEAMRMASNLNSLSNLRAMKTPPARKVN